MEDFKIGQTLMVKPKTVMTTEWCERLGSVIDVQTGESGERFIMLKIDNQHIIFHDSEVEALK